MVNVVICDDDTQICVKLKKCLKENLKFEYRLYEFHDFDLNFHEYILYNNIPTIYILDIELQNAKTDGYGIAKKIRKARAYNDEIIFLSSYTSGIINTYKYKIKPVDFIEKTNYYSLDIVNAVEEAKLRIDSRVVEEDSGSLLISEFKELFRIRYKHIISIEKIKNSKKVEIRTISDPCCSKEVYTTYKAIEKINEELDDRFCQISRGVIINKNYIRSVSSSGQVVMTNGQIFVTSAKKIKELKDEL